MGDHGRREEVQQVTDDLEFDHS